MTGRLAAWSALTVLSAAAQVNAPHTILAWFPDGAGVELYTEGSTHQTSVQGAGMIMFDLIHRVVVDNRNQVVFAYELEAEHSAQAGAVTIRIKPLSPKAAENIANHRKIGVDGADGQVPTVSAVREFRAVQRGQEVKIEILANPSTGERVYDVLRPIGDPSPDPGHTIIQASQRPVPVRVAPATVPPVSPPPRGLQVVVNGRAVAVRNSWTAGKPARLYLPGHGSFYLSWENMPKFRLAGYAEKNRLVFLMDSDYVEITSGSNILTTAAGGPVWVYHDPGYVPQPQDGAFRGAELTVADNLEALNAKK